MTTFSILIATYQGARTLPRALDSALAQTYPAHEIVVCDDGSTDNTHEVLARYGDRIIKVVTQTNQGQNAARNAAGHLATGEWVVLLDADDEWQPQRLQRIADTLVTKPEVDIVTTDAIVRTPGKPDRLWNQTAWPEFEKQRTAIINGNFIFGGAAIRRSVLEEIDWFRRGLPHDGEWEAWVRLLLRGSRAALVPEPLVIYHQDAGGQLSRNRVGTYRTVLAVIDEEVGKHGLEIDAVIGQRRKRVRVQLATAEGVRAVRNRDRLGCLHSAVGPHTRPAMRLKFAFAAAFPSLAARRVGVTASSGPG